MADPAHQPGPADQPGPDQPERPGPERPGPERPGPERPGRAGGGRWLAGLRLGVSVLSVLPVRAHRFDRPTAAVAMASAPLVGLLLGGAVAAVLSGAQAAHLPPTVGAALGVTAAVLLTRGLHLDGLADTVDALGSYRSAPAALDIMKKPDIGPFGVAAIALVLLLQVTALANVHPAAALLAWAAGRLAVPVACRRGVPPARPDGLGALVAGTVPGWALAVGVLTVGAGGLLAGWPGPLAAAAAAAVAVGAVAVAVGAAALVVWHAGRRFGGLTGDVIGAAVEVATTAALVVLSVR